MKEISLVEKKNTNFGIQWKNHQGVWENLTALCEPGPSILSSWDRNYLIPFSFVHS